MPVVMTGVTRTVVGTSRMTGMGAAVVVMG